MMKADEEGEYRFFLLKLKKKKWRSRKKGLIKMYYWRRKTNKHKKYINEKAKTQDIRT